MSQDSRVTELEIKVAYLEKNLFELDEVVQKLNESMGLLTGEIARLRREAAAGEKPASEKPPHY